jgi:ADP-heptose:LPS heptosyltransferase
MKCLIIRFGNTGELVLSTLLLRCLKKQGGDVELHYLTGTKYTEVLVANPHVDKWHATTGDIHSMIEPLKEEGFDYIIDLERNRQTAILKKALGVTALS